MMKYPLATNEKYFLSKIFPPQLKTEIELQQLIVFPLATFGSKLTPLQSADLVR